MKKINLLFLIAFLTPFSSMADDSLKSIIATYHSSAKEQLLDGVVEAVNRATLSAQISGRIIEVNFDVDDTVKKGDIILRIRDTEYKARLSSAKASLKEAQANLKDAQLEVKRITGLYKDKMVSAASFDKAKALLKASEARVAASRANISEAKEQLSNSIIRAPYSGIVVKRHVELGETLQPGNPVMSGFSLKKLRVAVDMPQNHINAVRRYKIARIVPLAADDETIEVKNMTIFPFANPKSHTFHIRVNLNKGIKTLYPGMLVKVAFKIDETKRLLIPHSAVVHRSEVIAVYIIDENKNLKLRQIRLGQRYGNNVEVLAGLTDGEIIASNPVKAGIALKSQANTAESI